MNATLPGRMAALAAVVGIVSVLVFPVGGVAAAPPSRPNIVLIMADDFGYECLAANGGESTEQAAAANSLRGAMAAFATAW